MGQKFAAYSAQGAITGFYDSTDSPAPPGIDIIKISDEQWHACISQQGQWYVSNGALSQVPPPSAAEQLADAKAIQTSKISAACAAAIISGATSSALGVPHVYPTKVTDQQNLTASVADALIALTDPAWAATTLVAAGSICVAGGVPYQCVVGGTTGAKQPAWPAEIGSLVNDGDAQWQLWSTKFWCEDAAGNWAWAPHTAAQIIQAGRDIKSAIMVQQAKCATLTTKVASVTLGAATDATAAIAAVQAITWL